MSHKLKFHYGTDTALCGVGFLYSKIYLIDLEKLVTCKRCKAKLKKSESQECDFDYSDIDEYDEISGDEQLCSVWCKTHRKYEQTWVDRGITGN